MLGCLMHELGHNLLQLQCAHPPSPVAGEPSVALQAAFPVGARNVPVEVCCLRRCNGCFCRDEGFPTWERFYSQSFHTQHQNQGSQKHRQHCRDEMLCLK